MGRSARRTHVARPCLLPNKCVLHLQSCAAWGAACVDRLYTNRPLAMHDNGVVAKLHMPKQDVLKGSKHAASCT